MNLLKKHWGSIIIIFFSLIPLLDLLHPGLPITHDGKDHIARIANFYQSLSEGNIVPRWAANLNWGYGHPILMFLYPLPSYIASLFHVIGFSLVDSFKLEFAVAYILSGLTMYLWMRETFDEYAGTVAGILYMYAPYRFVDMYIRGDIGEHLAFVFPPLICFFLLKLSKAKRLHFFSPQTYGLFLGTAISMAGLILAHNAITVMVIPFLAVYGVFLLFTTTQKKEFIVYGVVALGLGFLLAGFFLFPAFFEGKYTLRDIVTGKDYINNFVKPIQFLWGPWSYGGSGQFSVQIGLVHLVGIVLSLFAIAICKTKKHIRFFFGIAFIFFLGSLFLMLSQSNMLYKVFTILQKFQFPWRFLNVTVFCSAILSSFSVYLIKNKTIKISLVIAFIICSLIFNIFYMRAQGYSQKPESFYTGIYNGTTDTGESAPIWSVRFMEKQAPARIQFAEGSGSIKQIKRTTTDHEYLITVNQNSSIVENTLYFPGWEVLVDKNPVVIEFQNRNYRGLMTFPLSSGTHMVQIIFKETKLRLLSDMGSLVGLIIVIGYGIFVFLKKRYVHSLSSHEKNT